MAIVANTFLSYDSKGNREQLSNIIYNISPDETPLVSMLAKERVKGTLFEHQTDSLGAIDTANKHLEGDDIASFPAISATTRVGNYCQISRKLLMISGTQEELEKAGRSSEIAYQKAKRGAELKIDMEGIIFINQVGNAGSDTTARATATLGAWVKTNVNLGTGAAANPTWSSGVPGAGEGRTDGTQRAFTETIAKDVVQQAWTAGAKVDGNFFFTGPVNKEKFSAFAGLATKTYEISGRKPGQATIVGAADVYVSNYGTFTVMPHRYMRERDAYFIDPEFLAIAHFRPFQTDALAKTGDATKMMLLVEWGLKVKNEAALGLAADLTTT
jgi:hypothetical protein